MRQNEAVTGDLDCRSQPPDPLNRRHAKILRSANLHDTIHGNKLRRKYRELDDIAKDGGAFMLILEPRTP
jgi:hypothetical protein